MWAISRVGDESRGEEGLVSVVTRQRAPGQVQALHVTGTGDRSVEKNPKNTSIVFWSIFCQLCNDPVEQACGTTTVRGQL